MNSQTISQRPTFGFNFFRAAFNGGLGKPPETAENAQNGQCRGDAGVMPEQCRGDAGVMPEQCRDDAGVISAPSVDMSGAIQAMRDMDAAELATNSACKKIINAVFCIPEVAASLRATILEQNGDYETQITGMELMLEHFNAGMNVKVTELFAASANEEYKIAAKFQREKIKPILEQYGILVKKDDNTFRWARLDELQNLQKTGAKCATGTALCKTETDACATGMAACKTGSTAGATGTSKTSKQATGTASHPVGGKDAGAAGGALAQLSKNLPSITVRPEMVAGAVVGVAMGAGLYISWDAITHALAVLDAKLVAPAWYKPALNALGQASTLGVAAGLYGLQWAVRFGIHLPATAGYVLLGTLASAPVLTACGFDGGMLGQSAVGWLQAHGVAPSTTAAIGTAVGLFVSMKTGNPLLKLAVLFDLAGGLVLGLLPEGKEEPVVPVQPAPTKAVGTDALKAKMQETLDAYGLGYASVHDVMHGPVLDTFLVKIPLGKDTKEIAKQDTNIGRAFRAKGKVKIVEQVPGTEYSAIEVPRAKREAVALADLMATPEWAGFKAELPMLLGVDALGKPLMLDMAKAIHLLVAGTTGSGKSVFVNALLASLMSRMTPATLRIHLIDPKMLEFSLYEGSPFVEGEVVTDMELVRPMLEQLVKKMEARYKVMAHQKVRNIVEYNAKAAETGEFNPMPYELVVFDEFADLIMQDKLLQKMAKVKDEDGNTVVVTAAEEMIARLAQKARAAGIHLLLSTQRPTADVITGLIKTNVPTRIGMTVSTSKDSMNMLDTIGCEKLLGNGDAYGILPGNKALQRIHGGYVDGAEIEAAVAQQRKRWGK